ncbi:MAG: hypothetical protein R2864_11750 [Syntrophotaleaceae bacterium]
MDHAIGCVHPELDVIHEPEQSCLKDSPGVGVVHLHDGPAKGLSRTLQGMPRRPRGDR